MEESGKENNPKIENSKTKKVQVVVQLAIEFTEINMTVSLNINDQGLYGSATTVYLLYCISTAICSRINGFLVQAGHCTLDVSGVVSSRALLMFLCETM